MTLEQALKLIDARLQEAGYNVLQLPLPMRNLHLINSLDFEIANGGVDQWLTNPSGEYAAETEEALKTVGASLAAVLVREIIDTFPDRNVPKAQEERIRLVEELRQKNAERWRSLGDKILEWPDEINDLLHQYIAESWGRAT